MEARNEVSAPRIPSETQKEARHTVDAGDVGEYRAPPVRRSGMEGESYAGKPVFAGEEQQTVSARMNALVEESYGSSRFLPEEEGVSAQNNVVGAGETLESRRILHSCSMASTRVKKKRRSRASSKAPIKVFSTDTSNFMAMVHKLTAIPSNVPPFHSTLPPPWSPKILPFNQGLPTLDTSTLLLPSFSCARASNGISYPGMQALSSQQQLNPMRPDMKATSQPGQPPTNLDCASLCSSVNSSSFPRLWEASYTSQKSGAHQLQQKPEGISRQEFHNQDVAIKPNLPSSSTLSRIEMSLPDQDKLASSNVSMLSSCIAKEELL